MATKLTKLRIKELSGVDEPANELGGWIVQKSKDKRDEQIEQFEKDVVGLYDGLASESADLYFIDAPDSVLKARDELIGHIGAGLEDVVEEEPAEKSKGGIVAKLRDVLAGPEVEKAKADMSDQDEEEDGADGGDDESEEEDTAKAVDADDEEEVEKAEDEDAEEEVEKAEDDEDEIEKAADEAEDDETPAFSAEEVAKALTDEMALQLEPIREAVVGLADRVENIEKASAGRTSLDGQDLYSEEDTDQESGMAKAIRASVIHGKVELT